ncbi:MAG: 16S rRNA (cytidine(1402)-2'-O)-methyltransferase [Pseudomonadota bacterium]
MDESDAAKLADASPMLTPVLRQAMQQDFPPGLYLVATPIGNLADLTIRAAAILARADVICCEDTRMTRRLLDAYAIAPNALERYDDHTDAAARDRIVSRVATGQRVVLVSDAGTPLFSDPGFKLVRHVRDAGHAVVPVPGPSAAVAAASASGLPTDAILFAGFAPQKQAARRRHLSAFKDTPATLVFYEAPHRLAAFLTDAAETFGDRAAVVARELTKRFETFAEGSLNELAASFGDAPPKGEIVVLIARAAATAGDVTDEDIRARLAPLIAADGTSRAARQVATDLGLPRARVYALANALRNERGDD